MSEHRQPLSQDQSLLSPVFVGRIITLNGFMFLAMGIYLIQQTGTWQAYLLAALAVEVSLGALISIYLFHQDRRSLGNWILLITNLISPALAGLAVTRMGLVSTPYIIISSYVIISWVLPENVRKPAAIIAGITTLIPFSIEFIINPYWTLDSQIVLILGPIFIFASLVFVLMVLIFGKRWNALSVRGKLLFPLAAVLLVIISVLTWNGINNVRHQVEVDELRYLSLAYDNYNAYITSLENNAAALATSIADRPDVADLYKARNRQGLLDLLTPLFKSFKENYNVVHLYVEEPNGKVFVRVHDPEKFGDDVTYRLTAKAVLESQKTVAGVEIGPNRLGVRGVAPIYDGEEFIGMAEVGIDYDQAFIENLKEATGIDYSMWVTYDAAAPARLEPSLYAPEAPTSKLFYYASTYPVSLPIPEEVYLRVLESGLPETYYTSNDGQELVVMVAPLLGYGGRTIGVFEIILSRVQTLADVRSDTRNLLIIALAVTIVGFFVLQLFSQVIVLRPIEKLATTSRLQLAGDLTVRVPPLTNDEFGELANTLNTLTENLQGSLQNLEIRVEERTVELERATRQVQQRAEQLEAVAQIARTIGSIQNIEDLLPRIARMISQRFEFYHVGIFLLDENKEYAVLRAANSEGGRQMLARKHRLEVGHSGIVGYVTSSGNPRIALDTGTDAVFFDNPDLPETRSEMALPLTVGGQIIGALDVQSTQANAFSHEDLNIMSTLAGQVSSAIQNARLYEESRIALVNAESAYRQLTGQAWTNIRRFTPLVGYRFDGTKPEALTHYTDGDQTERQKEAFSIPVQLYGESIGRLTIKASSNEHQWTDDEITIIQATAERVALAAENARLVLESQKQAAKEQVIGEISSRIGASVSLDNILQTTIREMSRILPGAEISIQVENE